MSPQTASLICKSNSTRKLIRAYKSRNSAEDLYSTGVALVAFIAGITLLLSICWRPA